MPNLGFQENPYSSYDNNHVMAAGPDEHIIKCSYCGRDLIIKDNVNNGVAFLSHLKADHDIYYVPQQMTETKTKKQENSKQTLAPPE